MKRSLVAAALAAAMLLLAVPAVSGASTAGHRTGPPREGAPATAQAARAAWLRTQPRYIPAAEAIAGPAAADVTGTVFRYDGGPLADADMAWWIDADGSQGEGGTDADGKFFFGGVPVTDAGGTLRVDATDGTLSMAWWGLTWTAAGPNAFDLRPGGIEVEAEPGGPWGRRTGGMYTDMISIRDDSTGGWAGATSARLYTRAPVFPGMLVGGAVYFHPDEGVEIDDVFGITVEPGKTAAETIAVKQAEAQRVWTGAGNAALTGPWGSGKPGSTLKLWLQNYPRGWVNQVLGWSLDGERSAFKPYRIPDTTGQAKYAVRLTVPKEATPGYGYAIEIMHLNDGPLTLETQFQICTLEADRTSVKKGRPVRLSGVIPVQGHTRDAAGKSSRVYCWMHEGRAAQPTTLATRELRADGWKYVGFVRTDGTGAYAMPRLRPSKTTTYVMRYPGDGWYYPAYTSPLTITVK